MTTPLPARYAKLDGERADLEAKLKALKAKMAELEPEVLRYFEKHGLQSTKVNGRTIYLERTIWACKVDRDQPPEELFPILITNGFEEYASRGVSWQGLSALFREREKEGEGPVPEELRRWFDIEERFKIKGRKAS